MIAETKTEYILNEITTTYGHSGYTGIYALAAVINSLAAAGGTDLSVTARIEMPDYTFKSRLHAIEREIQSACEQYGVVLSEITTTKHTAVNLPAVTVSGIGLCAERRALVQGYRPSRAGCCSDQMDWHGRYASDCR